MTPQQPPKPIVFSAPSDPNRGRTALAFVLAAILLIGGALLYRAMGQKSRSTESGMSHCFEADYLATMALSNYSIDHKATGRLWRDAEKEYRAAIKMTPRMGRARRGLAAVKWLQGNTAAARATMSAPADIPAARRDTWLATQTAYGAIPRPAKPATLIRYRLALNSEDLGWSRYVARHALSSSEQESRRTEAQLEAVGRSRRDAMRARGLLNLLGFTLGLGVFAVFLSLPHRDRIAEIDVPGGVLVSAFLIGMAAQSLPGIPVHYLLGHFLETAGDDAYYLVVLLTHAAGLLLAAIAAQVLLRRNGESIRALGWDWLLAPVWGIGAYLGLLPVLTLAGVVSMAASRLFPNVETPINSAAWMAASAHGWSLVAVFLTVCVVGPLAEELLFRGFLFRGLMKSFGFWGGAILSSAAFAALHPQLPLGFLPIWCIGVGLCVVYQRSGSLTACWVLHGLNNSMALLGTLSAAAHLRLF